jgi:hypothetical protein
MSTNLDRLRSVQVSALAKEAAFGTAETVDSLIRWNSGVIPAQQVQTINDQDHIGGTEEPTKAEVFARLLAFPFTQTRCKPHTLGFVAAYAMGTVVTSLCGSTTYRHHITPAVATAQAKVAAAQALEQVQRRAQLLRAPLGCPDQTLKSFA